jgi:hypothetical protein
MVRLALVLCTMWTFHWGSYPEAAASKLLHTKAAETGDALRIGSVTVRLGMPQNAALLPSSNAKVR